MSLETHHVLEVSPDSDEALMERFRDTGDEQAFTALVRKYERELLRFLESYIGNRTRAEDVFQNTWLQVHRKKSQYVTGHPFRPWLFLIARNQAYDEVRKERRHPTVSLHAPYSKSGDQDPLENMLIGHEPGPPQNLESAEEVDAILRRIAKLPGIFQQALLLASDDLKYGQIAAVQGVSIGTVKTRVNAARKKLGTWCENNWGVQNGVQRTRETGSRVRTLIQ